MTNNYYSSGTEIETESLSDKICECGHEKKRHYKGSCCYILDGIKETVCKCEKFKLAGGKLV